MVAVFLPSQRLARPTASLSQHGRVTAPVEVGSRLHTQRGARVPSPLGGCALPCESLGDELTGHRPGQGQPSRV